MMISGDEVDVEELLGLRSDDCASDPREIAGDRVYATQAPWC